MKKNLGKFDRIVRFLAAIVIAVLYFMNLISGTLAIVLEVLAAAFVLTSFMGFCPIYWSMKINTLKNKFSRG